MSSSPRIVGSMGDRRTTWQPWVGRLSGAARDAVRGHGVRWLGTPADFHQHLDGLSQANWRDANRDGIHRR
jgi:hypothetical protein